MKLNHLVVGFLGLGLFGCDDGDGSFDTGLPPSQKFSDISEGDAKTFCKNASNSARSVMKDLCKVLAVASAASEAETDAELKKACQTAYDTCLEESDVDDFDSSCEEEVAGASRSCEATIGEYEKCFSDQIAQLKKLAGQMPSCASVTTASLEKLEDLESDYETPATCSALEDECPEIFGSF
jgi:hypothetical protein